MTNATKAIAPADQTHPFNRRRSVVVSGAAALLNLLVYAIASASGASMNVLSPSEQHIPPVVAVLATLVPLSLAAVVTWFVVRRWPRFLPFAAWAGLAFGVLTAASPMASSADIGTGVGLAVMHIVAGVAWFVMLRAPRSPR